MEYSRQVILLGVPICEMVCGQVQGLWTPNAGSLSLAQVYHGVMLCVVSLYLVSRLYHPCNKPLATTVCIAMFLLVTCASTAMALRHNGHILEDGIALSQILYWILVWCIYVIECSTAEGRTLILKGVFAGGVYMAVSVVVLHVVGGSAYSRYEGVDASFGGFSTAKSLGGVLCVTALLSLRMRSTPVQVGLLGTSLTGLMLTYQRAGQLAMLVAVAWLVVANFGARIKTRWVSARSIIAFACILVVVAGFVDMEALAGRWENVDLSLGDKAGSGRLGLWTNAVHAFEGMKGLETMLGLGYSGMRDAMLQEGMGGNRKHTHSDVLDILLAFGILGLSGWIAIHYAVIRTLCVCARVSGEYVIGGAVYIIFLVESLVTGQVFGPATMIVYLGAIMGLCGGGRELEATAPSVVAPVRRWNPQFERSFSR